MYNTLTYFRNPSYYLYLNIIQIARKQNVGRGKKCAIKKDSHDKMRNLLGPMFTACGGSPHHVIELSEKEVSNMKSNSIHLSGIKFEKEAIKGPKIASYNTIIYGSKVKHAIIN